MYTSFTAVQDIGLYLNNFVTFLDAATKWASIALLENRHDVITAIKRFTEQIENEMDIKIKRFYLDNAKEFKSIELVDYFADKKIIIIYSVLYYPE